jgi:hypothetical protein
LRPRPRGRASGKTSSPLSRDRLSLSPAKRTLPGSLQRGAAARPHPALRQYNARRILAVPPRAWVQVSLGASVVHFTTANQQILCGPFGYTYCYFGENSCRFVFTQVTLSFLLGAVVKWTVQLPLIVQSTSCVTCSSFHQRAQSPLRSRLSTWQAVPVQWFQVLCFCGSVMGSLWVHEAIQYIPVLNSHRASPPEAREALHFAFQPPFSNGATKIPSTIRRETHPCGAASRARVQGSRAASCPGAQPAAGLATLCLLVAALTSPPLRCLHHGRGYSVGTMLRTTFSR